MIKDSTIRYNSCKYHPNIDGKHLMGGIHSNAVTVDDFNCPFSARDRSFRQKVNEDTSELNGTVG